MSAVTCVWCRLTHESPHSEVVHRGTLECVDAAACAARMAQQTEDRLTKERDEARAEVERLRAQLRTVAERQREACAAVGRVETDYDSVHIEDPEEVARATPLVTEKDA